jgi:hypothetical protein
MSRASQTKAFGDAMRNPEDRSTVSAFGHMGHQRSLTMRIAQVASIAESVPPKFYGGTERVVHWLTEELVHQGHSVTLFASGDSMTSAEHVSCVPQGLRLAGIRDHVASHLVMLNEVMTRAHEFDVISFTSISCNTFCFAIWRTSASRH